MQAVATSEADPQPPPQQPGARTCIRRHPEDGVLHRVLLAHLETFLAEAKERGDGTGLPCFVERELRDYLTCGVMARGFARFRCDACQSEVLVAFSCKGRAFCPSCCGRRMATLAAHLTDQVLGGLPVRQWVLTLPHRLRYALAFDHTLCRAALAVFMRALLGLQRRRARKLGGQAGLGGAVTAIQRAGSAVNLNLHFHTLCVEGVFVDQGSSGAPRFVPLPAPSDEDVARLLAVVARRIVRLVKRHGIDLQDPSAEAHPADPLATESPVLAGIGAASVQGRVATGPRAGAPVLRVGRNPDAAWVFSSGAAHAHLAGFDLHAAVAVPAGDRRRLEHLCRYVLRPPIAQGALELMADGRVQLKIRRPWHDGTRAILFEPVELIEKLASLVPRPRVNLLIYHGVLAPNARLRRAAVRAATGPAEAAEQPGLPSAHASPDGSPGSAQSAEADPSAPTASSATALAEPAQPPRPAARPECGDAPSAVAEHSEATGSARRKFTRYVGWAELLRRTFEVDILACDCGGRLRFIATIEAPPVIRRILAHLGLPTECPIAAPGRPPPGGQQSLFVDDV